MKLPERGVTLIEIIVTVVIFSAMLFAMTKLMISFARFASSYTQNEGTLMGNVAAFEHIVTKITASNQATFSAEAPTACSIGGVECTVLPGCTTCSIDIRVSPLGAAATFDHANDTHHYYWQDSSNQLCFASRTGTSVPMTGKVLADRLISLSFASGGSSNKVSVHLVAQRDGNADDLKKSPRETFHTVAVIRARNAQ